jgi:hypothetical protein
MTMATDRLTRTLITIASQGLRKPQRPKKQKASA